MRPPFERLKQFVKAHVSTRTFPGLYLMLCLLALMVSVWGFGAIAEDVATGDPMTITDVRFSAWLHAHSTPSVTFLMRVITELHSLWVVAVVTLAVCAYWWMRGRRNWVFTLMLAVFGGMLLNLFLKHLFLRARPHFDDPMLTLTTYSFPSGHTLIATAFYGTLCWFILRRSGHQNWRFLAIPASLILIALVGFSRIYLGAHYLSDVLGAIAEGLAWLAFCLIGTEAIKRRHDYKTREADHHV